MRRITPYIAVALLSVLLLSLFSCKREEKTVSNISEEERLHKNSVPLFTEGYYVSEDGSNVLNIMILKDGNELSYNFYAYPYDSVISVFCGTVFDVLPGENTVFVLNSESQEEDEKAVFTLSDGCVNASFDDPGIYSGNYYFESKEKDFGIFAGRITGGVYRRGIFRMTVENRDGETSIKVEDCVDNVLFSGTAYNNGERGVIYSGDGDMKISVSSVENDEYTILRVSDDTRFGDVKECEFEGDYILGYEQEKFFLP